MSMPATNQTEPVERSFSEAPGLPANWLNGWLAAIGVTVLLEDVTLHWTDDAVPHAVFGSARVDRLAGRITDALPSPETLQTSPIARSLDGLEEYSRKVTLQEFAQRATYERRHETEILASSSTDLIATDRILKDGVEHAPLNPPVPRGYTLWDRALATATALEGLGNVEAVVRRSLEGHANRRIPGNGLGFDLLRMSSSANAQSVSVDPVVELLAYAGLRILPMRGNGHVARQRLWTDRATRRHAMQWPAWNVPLERWGIDAILDRSDVAPITRIWGSVPYVPATSSDTTRGYGSEALI